jgi:hypothetical protein
MIIFRVTTGRSFTKLPSVKDGVLKPLQFAHPTAESSFLQSTLNHEIGRNRDPDSERVAYERGLTQPDANHPYSQEKRDSSEDVDKV